MSDFYDVLFNIEQKGKKDFVTLKDGRVIFIGGPSAGSGQATGGIAAADFTITPDNVDSDTYNKYERGLYTVADAAKASGRYDEYVNAVAKTISPQQISAIGTLFNGEQDKVRAPESEQEAILLNNLFRSGLTSVVAYPNQNTYEGVSEGFQLNELGSRIYQMQQE